MTSDPELLSADNVKRFDDAAADWEEKPQRVALARKVAEAIQRAIPLASTMQVLEYGCGTGLVSRALSPHFATILAVDTSPQMLEVLRQKARDEKIGNIETLAHDLTRQPLPNNNFDLVMSSMTLHHIPDVEALLTQFFAALKPGGYLTVADLLTEDGSFHDDNSGVAHYGINPEEIRAILAKNGGLDIAVQEIHTIEKQQGNGAKRGYPVFLAWCRKGK
ncbi:MAG: class I SAM-dependent methyltransferase [Deltaproteobacteria bacterium]|nr:class I SAM-dependent methyltransferase [Deltaproteobacteria bacterium]